MDTQNFVAKLQQHMAELKPLKSPSNRKQKIFVHKDLREILFSHVFIRIDRVKKSLESSYEGPYAVQKKFNILKDNWGRWKQHSRALRGSFMAHRKPRVLTLGQS
ncbi:hypothetical protein TNCV_209511 [Trichonephila clavipes]|uniref:Uncharacterized protein n=1 Tax=Trichonephila clavipes TaxID=2585209 RepID=A0A8X6VS70_TRICX|nr:hypothetical protein TNCV_209511 [Trichonephila clavipes]